MTFNEMLDMWLLDNAAGQRKRERYVRKQADTVTEGSPYQRIMLTLADAHGEAATVYETALAKHREEAPRD